MCQADGASAALAAKTEMFWNTGVCDVRLYVHITHTDTKKKPFQVNLHSVAGNC